jgi:hypothetical protein
VQIRLAVLTTGGRSPSRCLLPADILAKVGALQLGRNNRIATSKFLNQHFVPTADLESMLLSRTPKIFLQQYRPIVRATAAHHGDWFPGSCAFPWCSPPGMGFRARPRQLSEQVPP